MRLSLAPFNSIILLTFWASCLIFHSIYSVSELYKCFGIRNRNRKVYIPNVVLNYIRCVVLMVFVRKKKVNNIEYAYLVENKRYGSKIKQIILYSLGRVDKLLEVL